MIFISIDALSPINRKIVSTDSYDTLIDFLQDKYPEGFYLPTDIFKSFNKVEVEDYDVKLNEDDIVTLVHRPAVAAALGITNIFLAWVVNTAVMLAVNFAVSKLFAPAEQAEIQSPSTVYSLNNAQNQAKLGLPIPIGYGKFRMYPSYVEQPYYRIDGHIEYLYLLLCVGQGRYNLDKLQIDTVDVTNSSEVSYRIVNKENFSNIKNFIGDYKYQVRVNTLGTPANLVKERGDKSATGTYNINPEATYLEYDIDYPQGLSDWDSNGIKQAHYTHQMTINYGNGVLENHIFTDVSMGENVRNTRTIPLKNKGTVRRFAWRVIDFRTQASPIVLSKVKEIFHTPNVTNYGDITLLWVKIKATSAISSIGQQKVNGFFTRTDVPNDIKSVLSDIYTNKTYGGGLNSNDLYFPTTSERVNGVFESKQTVFDAMKSTAKAQKYTVYPVGQDILLKKDAPTNITVGLYNETNILKGSFNIVYSFNDEIEAYDCIEVTYRNSTDWELNTNRYPTNGLSPQVIPLFGVTDGSMAATMSKYLWKQDAFRRKIITFDTDIQGFILEFLDKIKISHSALLWGEAGIIEDVNGNNITTSDKVSSNSNITIRNIDGSVSDMLNFSKINDYEISVNNLPSWAKIGLGYTIGVAKEFLVTSVTPKDENTVTVECVEYDEGIYL